MSKIPRVLAIGGGKGGVGKSLLAANLAIFFGKYGFRTIAVDADFGCSNLHTCLGMGKPERSMADFIDKRVSELEDAAVPTPYDNLRLISAHVDHVKLTQMHHNTADRLQRALRRCDADYIIIDMGAGSTREKIDFFVDADWGILVVTPEPTSVDNAYSFLKSCILRLTSQLRPSNNILQSRVVDFSRNPRETFKTQNLLDVVGSVKTEFAQELSESLASIRPLLIMNMVRENSDRNVGEGLESIIKKYLHLDAKFIGYIPYDAGILRSVRESRPIANSDDPSRSVQALKNILGQISFIDKHAASGQ